MIKVDESRHWDRLMQLAALGAIPDAAGALVGVNRACLTPLDRQARRLMIGWAQALGLSVAVDALGNLFFRREGTDALAAPVLAGSHMDSQPYGGRFDGIWGVLAALDAVGALVEAGIDTLRPIEVVAWTNEEGGRFAPGCMGSMAWTGHSAPTTWDAVTDAEGVRFGDALRDHLAAEADLPRRPLGPVDGAKPFAYVEPHIEQGPLLEAGGLDIGVVTGIQGSRWFVVELVGESAHAGTAPLSTRKDAVQDMHRVIEALNALTYDPTDVLRFTIGRIEVSPNSSNSVAERVRFSIDLRHPDKEVLLLTGDAVARTVEMAVKTCAATVTETFHALPVGFDPMVQDAIEDATTALGLSPLRLPSGAFHDAQFLGGICPAGMIFVPSRKGISHNPAEYTTPAQLAAGTRVLAGVLADLANRAV